MIKDEIIDIEFKVLIMMGWVSLKVLIILMPSTSNKLMTHVTQH